MDLGVPKTLPALALRQGQEDSETGLGFLQWPNVNDILEETGLRFCRKGELTSAAKGSYHDRNSKEHKATFIVTHSKLIIPWSRIILAGVKKGLCERLAKDQYLGSGADR